MANETFSFEEAVGPETFSFEDAIVGSKPPSDEGSQLVKGAQSGVTGLKSMWESAGVLKDAMAAQKSQSALKMFDDIEFGRVAKPEQLDTRTPQQKQRGDLPDFAAQQARQYMTAAPDVREAMRTQLAGDLSSRKELVAASLETLRKYQEDSQRTKGRVPDLTDVAGVNDFKDWLAFNAGSGAVSMAPIILAAVATGGLGAGVMGYGMAVSDLNKDRIDNVTKAKGTTDDVIQRVQDTAGSTFGAAVPYAALDVVAGPVRGVVANAAKSGLKKQTMKQVAKEVPGDLLEEGLAEGAQEAIKIGTSVGLGEEDKFFTAENAKRIFNAGAAGAAGAPLGTGIKAAQTFAKAEPVEPTAPKPDPVQTILQAGTVDDAITAAMESTTEQPIAKASDADLLARLTQAQPEQARQPAPPIEPPAPAEAPADLPPIAWPEQPAQDEAPTAMQLAMQRAQQKAADVSTTPDLPRPVATSGGAGRIDAPESLGNGVDAGERPGADPAGFGDSGLAESGVRAPVDAAGPLTFPYSKNESGTVLVTGDPAEIRAAFPDIKGMVKSANGQPVGVLFGTSAAPAVLAKLEPASVQNTQARTNTEAQAAPDQAPAPARPDASGQPAARAEAGAGALAADGVKPVDQRLVPMSKRAAASSKQEQNSKNADTKNPPTRSETTQSNAAEANSDDRRGAALRVQPAGPVVGEDRASGIPSSGPGPERGPGLQGLGQSDKRTSQGGTGVVAERPTKAPQGKEVSRYIGKFNKGMGRDAARLEAQRLNRTSTDKSVTYSAEEHDDPKLENPYAVVGRKVQEQRKTAGDAGATKNTEQNQALAPVESASPATENVADTAKKEPQFSRATEPKPADHATEILDAAGVSGKERIDVLKDVKAGTITPAELLAAYPAKESAKSSDKRPAANVAPVSRSPSETPMYEAMRQLSRFEGSFQTARSDSQDLTEIAQEMTSKNPDLQDFTVEKSTALHQGNRKPTLALKVTLANGNEVKLLDIFDADKAKPFVVIGNSEVGQGVGGATAYQIAFAWAHNNGKTMKPDPAGLTVINRLRRTEAMVSSAMQFGTTQHLEPHQDQYVALLERMRDGGKEPEDTHYSSRPDIHSELEALKEKLWTSGDSPTNIAANVQHLLEASTQLAYAREPAIRNFEVADGVLRVRNGREGTISLANDALADSSDATKILGVVLRPAVSGVGASTLRRAAVSGSVARAVQDSGQGNAVPQGDNNQSLDVAALQAIRGVLGKLDTSTPEVGKNVFYSRGAGPARGITQAQFTAELTKAFGAKVADKLQAKGVVVPLADQSKLPEHVVPFLRDGDIVFGFYDYKTNKTYAVLENLTPKMVKGLTLHEVGVHYGFENMLGPAKYAAVVKRMDLMRKAGNKVVKAAHAEAVANAVNEYQVTEETIAYLVQNHPDMPLVAEIIAKIKAFLFNNFGIGGRFLTADDIQMLARAAVDHASRDKDGGSLVPAFMKTNVAVNNQDGSSAVIDQSSSIAVSKLNRVMRDAGWEVEYIDIDLTAEKPKATIRVNRDDGRFLIAKLDSLGRANFETFQRERSLGMNESTKGKRPLTPLVDDVFLGRQRFEGARSMLRGMTNYLTDNASNTVALADMRSAWAGIMNAPVKQEGGALLANESTAPDSGGAMFSRIGANQSANLPDETRGQKIQRVMQDKYNRVKLIQDLLREDGGTVGEKQDVYQAEERMHGRVHEVLRDFADDVIKPLIQKATDYKVDLNELAAYAYAKHAAERNEAIQKINKNVRTGSGMSDADAQKAIDLVKATGKEKQFEELHADLMAITSTTRRLMLDEGLITQEQYDALENQYENYVPLRGFEDVEPDSGSVRPGLGRGFNTKGKETIAALGRDSKAGDIIENIIRDYERATIRAERNTVGKTFLDLVTSNPDPKLWEVQPVTRVARKVNDLVEYVDTPDKGDETISVKVGGEQVYIKINDPLLLRAMRNTFKAETSDAERFLSKTLGMYTSLLRNTITRYNPAFGVINAVRDVQMGAMGVYDELGAEGVRRYAANYGPAVASSGRAEFGKNDPQRNNMDKWMREMRFAGGTTGGVFMRDHDTIKRELRDTMLQAGVKPNGVIEGVRASNAWKAAGKLLHGLELIGSMSENSARLAAYATAREMGKTPAQAASIAKNLTVNFNRFGEQGQLINTAFLFYNASVQGTVRIAQMAKNPKVRKAFAGMTAAGMGLALMGAAVGGDDEDGQAYWDKIPDFEKERNLIIMLPPGVDMGDKVGTHGRYIKIPMAYGLNVFPVLGYQLADLARNVKDPAQGVGPTKAAINMLSATAGSYNPAGGSFDPRDKVQLAMAVSPTIVDAGIQLGAGVDSFGKPTGPQRSPYDQKPDSETVSAQNHGSINHRIARWLNDATGGNRARSGAIDVEPGTIKNVQGILAGGLGKFVGDVVNLGYLGATDAPIKDRDIPIWKAFYGEYDSRSGMSQFYERSRKASEEFDDMKAEFKLGIKREYSDEEKFLQGMGAYAASVNKMFGDLKKAEVAIAESNSTTKEKELKRRMIQKRREKMAEDFNAKWYAKESELKRKD